MQGITLKETPTALGFIITLYIVIFDTPPWLFKRIMRKIILREDLAPLDPGRIKKSPYLVNIYPTLYPLKDV